MDFVTQSEKRLSSGKWHSVSNFTIFMILILQSINVWVSNKLLLYKFVQVDSLSFLYFLECAGD